ncbi:TlpA family protein disulfide reductase [Streptacidiphilus carbonis]|uniref:TlpA family protein disulfide reductase n=1 Tax=Streptacidiphilus carbonis TaxID=105422 RepID=UPI0005A622C8|nr:TlpA disulfide reductase family protein [Streptacidiphilus carbonis]
MRSRPLRSSSARTLIAALAAASALALAGCSTSSGSSDSANTQFVKGTGQTSTVAVKDRKAPISISGKDLDGNQLSVADYRGRIVVLNVWGSWCSPCRAEADGLETVYTADKAKGVQFVGIDTRDLQTAQPKAFVADHHLTYPSLYDPTGDLLLKFPAGTLNPQAIPTTIILDRQGRVAARALLPLSAPQLTQMLAPLLAEKS